MNPHVDDTVVKRAAQTLETMETRFCPDRYGEIPLGVECAWISSLRHPDGSTGFSLPTPSLNGGPDVAGALLFPAPGA